MLRNCGYENGQFIECKKSGFCGYIDNEVDFLVPVFNIRSILARSKSINVANLWLYELKDIAIAILSNFLRPDICSEGQLTVHESTFHHLDQVI